MAVACFMRRNLVTRVNDAYSRENWSSCFVATFCEEIGLISWKHTRRQGEDIFPDEILGEFGDDEIV